MVIKTIHKQYLKMMLYFSRDMELSKPTVCLLAIILAFAILAIPISNYKDQSFASNTNTTKNQNVSSGSDLLDNRGLNSLSYTKNTINIAGMPINEIYVYNSVNHQLTHVDNDNKVLQKNLTNDQINELNTLFYSNDLGGVYDRTPCPECTQYGLSFAFVDLEKLVKMSEFYYWTDATQIPGVEGLKNITSYIENITSQ